jgi:hypothetical protein
MVIAYLDGATGGLIIQTLVAGLVALPFILRAQVARGLSFIRRRGRPADEQEGQPKDS